MYSDNGSSGVIDFLMAAAALLIGSVVMISMGAFSQISVLESLHLNSQPVLQVSSHARIAGHKVHQPIRIAQVP